MPANSATLGETPMAQQQDQEEEEQAEEEIDVELYKADKGVRLGVTLIGSGTPMIEWVADEGVAHGKLFVGDRLLSINGWRAKGHAETTKRLKQRAGTIKLKVVRTTGK